MLIFSFYLIVERGYFASVGPRHLYSGTVEEEGAVTRVRILSGSVSFY
jgi:hypothetical protein